VLCSPEVAPGFGLAGLPTVEAEADQDVSLLVDAEVGQPEVGVVLMQERLYDRLPEEARRRLGKRALPMVVPFPDPTLETRPEAAEAYIVELLRQVVGYRVRLR
jgi:vacuolar-type H+-ATPase subunit F/Vma7